MPDATRWWCPVHGYDIRPTLGAHGLSWCTVDGCGQLPLYETAKGWTEPAPQRCPNGHELGPGQVSLSSLGCINRAVHNRDGHRVWTCRRCRADIYAPARGEGCARP